MKIILILILILSNLNAKNLKGIYLKEFPLNSNNKNTFELGAIYNYFTFGIETTTGDIDYLGVNTGFNYYKKITPLIFYTISGSIGVGKGSKKSLNSNYISFGATSSLNYILHKKYVIGSVLNYKHYLDITPNTTCNDGSSSDSKGQGTCSYHGGIKHYNEKIGDFRSLSLGLQLMILF